MNFFLILGATPLDSQLMLLLNIALLICFSIRNNSWSKYYRWLQNKQRYFCYTFISLKKKINSTISFKIILILISGFSRIPVYEGTRRNIVSLLYIKDLALIDPDDNTPLKTLSQFYQNSCYYVFEDTTLDVVFKQFKEGE